MENLLCSGWFIVTFWIIASISSFLCSKYAFEIHHVAKTEGPSLFHQYILNFLGSFLGWILLWIVFPNLIDNIKHVSTATFTVKDIILTILAFIGITGYLPAALVGLAMSFKEIFSRLLK